MVNYDDSLVSNKLNNFFRNATKTLNINGNPDLVDSSSSITDPVDKAIKNIKPPQYLANETKIRKC